LRYQKDPKLSKDQIKNLIPEAIRQELFKLAPQNTVQKVMKLQQEKLEEKNRERKEFLQETEEDENVQVFRAMKGVRLWGNNESTEDNKLLELQNNYNKAIKKRVSEIFCPRCHSNPCQCREEY
jgi:hypothetical protein